MEWKPQIDWASNAGAALLRLFSHLRQDRPYSITLFGSSPLQLSIDSTFLSADIDLFAGEWSESIEDLQDAIRAADLEQRPGSELYVQVCVESNFRASPRWGRRAFTTEVGKVRLVLPHPIDILIGKLHRLEEKDLRAFRLVISHLGIPTEEMMRQELQVAVDLFRPGFDEEMSGDITTNTRVLWQELWGKEIDVRREIIAPALAARRRGYALDAPRRSYNARLGEIGQRPEPPG